MFMFWLYCLLLRNFKYVLPFNEFSLFKQEDSSVLYYSLASLPHQKTKQILFTPFTRISQYEVFSEQDTRN
jgi:muconolactone delta-isomerase